MDNKPKYTSDIAEMLETAEKVGIKVYKWSEKWEVKREWEGVNKQTVTLTLEGENLEELLIKILENQN